MVVRYALQSWLRNAAREKVRQKVVEAAEEHVRARTEAGQEPDDQEPRECHVGLVFALGVEAGGLEDLLDGVALTRGYGFTAREGTLGERRVVIVVSGPGEQKAAAATEALIAGHRPQWVISAGFAGGLDATLHRHDILMADHLVDEHGGRLAVDVKVQSAPAGGPPVRAGTLLTVDRILRSPDQKRALGQKFAAQAVDMESFAVAGVCSRRGTRFLAVRIVSDAVDDELPRDVERLLNQPTTAARLGAAVGSIWRRPSSLKDLWKLKEDALAASDRLGKFLAGMIGRL